MKTYLIPAMLLATALLCYLAISRYSASLDKISAATERRTDQLKDQKSGGFRWPWQNKKCSCGEH